MGVSTWSLGCKHTIIFQNPASSNPPPSIDTYLAEDGTTVYAAEDGTTVYVPEQ